MTTPTMTLPRREAPEPARPERRPASRLLSEPVLLFAVSAVLYLMVAVWLVQHNVLFADAMSRVGNAYYVLYSRDPHLPAIGFVWNPLPSLLLVPFLPLKLFAPWLVSYGVLGAIESALMMAGTVALIAGCLRKLNVPRVTRLILTGLFALQPMIMLYAGSGLSEAMMLFFLALTTSCLISWVQTSAPGCLVGTGLALGLCYMTRYEAVAPAVGVAALVGIASWVRARDDRSRRLSTAVNNVALVAAPFAFAFVLWSLMAKVLVNEWLPTFSSVYGNSAQVTSGSKSIQAVTGSTWAQTLEYIGRQTFGLAPVFGLLLIATLVLAVRARSLSALVAPIVFGAVSAFSALVLLMGSSFGWLRFQITVIPLTVLLAGTVVALSGELARKRADRVSALEVAAPSEPSPRHLRTRTFRPVEVGVAILVVAALAISVPAQFQMLTDTRAGLAREESPMLRSVFYPDLASHEEQRSLLIFKTERQVAEYIDSLDPGESSVLTDTAYAYSIVMASRRPTQFVITSDLDFQGAVADPAGHGVKYLLVPAPELGPADAVGHHWPGLFQNGAGIATEVQHFQGAFYGDWKLYRVN
ncbi:phospholipid carrier-dependent glycosyltransferase [Nakamurella sp.]|uniref:phospholipid carrier-dependent glycosyltransferase n=1 Tax=Nakamurella sp. TaxID=1869182 RepID=UPI0037832724